MERIPAIDVLNGRVVRLRQGRLDRVTVFGTDPLAVARRFAAAGARRVHLVDLAAAFGRPGGLGGLVGDIRALGLAVQVGGGIRCPDDARRALDLGADRVVVGSAAADPARLAALLAAVGPERLAVAIDARGDRLLVSGWTAEADTTVWRRLQQLVQEGVRRVVYTDTTRDGMGSGPDLEAARRLASLPLGVIVAGGVASVADLDALAAIGVEGAVVGRALYEGAIPLGSLCPS